MNKGTPEGTLEEIKLVKLLNKKFEKTFWNILGLDFKYNYAIHVISHQYAVINDAKIKPKADIFIASGNISQECLKEKGFYLNEDDLKKFKLMPLKFSGISVKRSDSNKYQILKMNPNTFQKVFASFELGAGASIYCNNSLELKKNDLVLKGWKTTWEKFEHFFNQVSSVENLKSSEVSSEIRLGIAKKIKSLSNNIVAKKIEEHDNISKFVFQGIGNLNEPYTAHWLYDHGSLKKAGKIPFVVTTGSGRTKGDYTVVIKPK